MRVQKSKRTIQYLGSISASIFDVHKEKAKTLAPEGNCIIYIYISTPSGVTFYFLISNLFVCAESFTSGLFRIYFDGGCNDSIGTDSATYVALYLIIVGNRADMSLLPRSAPRWPANQAMHHMDIYVSVGYVPLCHVQSARPHIGPSVQPSLHIPAPSDTI
jgi:hypothetical protein